MLVVDEDMAVLNVGKSFSTVAVFVRVAGDVRVLGYDFRAVAELAELNVDIVTVLEMLDVTQVVLLVVVARVVVNTVVFVFGKRLALYKLFAMRGKVRWGLKYRNSSSSSYLEC